MNICECGKPFSPASKGYGQKICRSCVTNRRRFEKKKRAVEYLGGKCVDCGYDRYIEALEFDHIDPSKKDFTISGNHCVSWERIKEELDKCELRCANCHRERHAREKFSIPSQYPELESNKNLVKNTTCENCNESFFQLKSEKRRFCSTKCIQESQISTSICPNCNQQFTHIKSDKRRFCSTKCSGEKSKKIIWPEIQELILLIQSNSFVYASSVLGVCDNAIRKHLIRNGINPKDVRNITHNKFTRQ